MADKRPLLSAIKTNPSLCHFWRLRLLRCWALSSPPSFGLVTSPCFDDFPLFPSLQELQSLENSNSAIQKDIDSLKKELYYYTLVLERHKPFCCLKDAVAGSASMPDGLAGSPAAVTRASASPQTAGLSLLTSFDSSSTSSTPGTAFTSPYDLGTSTSALTTSAHSDSFPPLLPSHSLFAGHSPPLTTLEGATPACTLPITAPATSPPNRVALSDHPLSALFSTPVSKGTFLMNRASSSAPFSYSHSAAEKRGRVSSPVHVLQLPTVHSKHLRPMENSLHSSLPSSHLSPYPQSLSAAPQETASTTSSGGGFGQNISSESESLLSLLIVPPPLSLPPSDFISFPESSAQSSLSPLFDISTDVSLSELLTTDEWILE